ncbi:hypothetical protein [Streptomyces sp. NPDC056672]|uniref:hypothetical protein n=1 Tax=Streptomyces sp. NPDC056672 TaxID=3345906 RepID=UPI0036918C8E
MELSEGVAVVRDGRRPEPVVHCLDPRCPERDDVVVQQDPRLMEPVPAVEVVGVLGDVVVAALDQGHKAGPGVHSVGNRECRTPAALVQQFADLGFVLRVADY